MRVPHDPDQVSTATITNSSGLFTISTKVARPLADVGAGISWPVQERTSDPVAIFFQPVSKLSWHWNWNKNWDRVLPETTPDLKIPAEFVPMIFSPNHLNDGVDVPQQWRVLMGFNEPDHDDPSVATKCSPAEAAVAWTKLAALRKYPHQKLVSPGIAWDFEWLRNFLSLIPAHIKPDYLNVHIYTTTFDSFQSQVKRYHSEFGLPLIITEFAMHSFNPMVPPPRNQQQVHDFMGQVTQWLDKKDYIAAYSWFGAVRDGGNLHGVHHFNRLMNEEGKLTPLGRQYVFGGHT
ncbi:hypothetical protein TREMEDRAFT_69512 [Tremella mesenterica DSM 1558]|uniref:uncharacterized protein n=1 Tax=Tremella mesenterica (strain ATCC 24925 / CBS 8224 / DSM 1558 / NBRC 9311 / NRRL Y-6157 / RJB 2259-6 / UBC 559-6) TaxID=578456 RepID=UPI0003F49E82|nr:uncharacterized protein TREMEDRAFT_69512 [Tremella mesenterica DSM 1558]EIW67991.1 hypothetical protein TREMEDRAFT_69512 [Tremella mesenterica DSM 1558]